MRIGSTTQHASGCNTIEKPANGRGGVFETSSLWVEMCDSNCVYSKYLGSLSGTLIIISTYNIKNINFCLGICYHDQAGISTIRKLSSRGRKD